MNKKHWLWTFIGLTFVGVLTAVMVQILESQHIKVEASFLKFDPLTPGRHWILAVWIPFFFVNIMGEEILWRGIMFPRQELYFGKYTWIVHGVGWFLFHIAFGWPYQPYIVQKNW
eukprot:222196_1